MNKLGLLQSEHEALQLMQFVHDFMNSQKLNLFLKCRISEYSGTSGSLFQIKMKNSMVSKKKNTLFV